MPKTTDGKQPESKMDAVRQLLKSNPNMKAAEISQAMKAQFNMDMSRKVAGTYRYHVMKENRRRGRKKLREIANPPAIMSSPAMPRASTEGLDDLLRAAEKLGWQRVKEIVDKVVSAPA